MERLALSAVISTSSSSHPGGCSSPTTSVLLAEVSSPADTSDPSAILTTPPEGDSRPNRRRPLRMSIAVVVVRLWLQLKLGALRVLERLPEPGATSPGVCGRRRRPGWGPAAHRPRWRLLATPWPTVLLACSSPPAPCSSNRRSMIAAPRAAGPTRRRGRVVVERSATARTPSPRTRTSGPPTTGPARAVGRAVPRRHAYAAASRSRWPPCCVAAARCGSWQVPSLTACSSAPGPLWRASPKATTTPDGVRLAILVLVCARPPYRGSGAHQSLGDWGSACWRRWWRRGGRSTCNSGAARLALLRRNRRDATCSAPSGSDSRSVSTASCCRGPMGGRLRPRAELVVSPTRTSTPPVAPSSWRRRSPGRGRLAEARKRDRARRRCAGGHRRPARRDRRRRGAGRRRAGGLERGELPAPDPRARCGGHRPMGPTVREP